MKKIVMLLTNAFMPDARSQIEAISLIKAGHEVKILCWDRGEGLPKRELKDGIAIERIRLRSRHGRGTSQIVFLGLLWLIFLVRLLKERFDVVYCHDFDTLPVGVMIKILKRKRLIFDSHEVYSKMIGKHVWRPLRRFTEYLEKTLIKVADRAIVTCQAMAELYASYGAKDIRVISNVKDNGDFHISANIIEEEKKKLGIKNELVISYIANLTPERIIEPLIEAVKDDKGLFLILGGDGPQRDMAERASRASGNIKYLGYISYEKVPLYTVLSDIVYYGYDRNFEMAEFNSPNKLFEALAGGRAFLGGNFGQMGDIVIEENCGIALDTFTKESIRKAMDIFKDKAALNTFKENAKKAGIEKYNWANLEKEFLGAFA